MGSQPRLWQRYGEAYGWPRSTMTFDEDRADLARHEREMDALESFNYAILDDAETKLLGCLYIDPPGPGAPPGAEATASWWVVDEAVGTPLELELSEALPRWLADAWGSGPCITTRERPVRLGVEQKEERSPAEASVSSR